MKTKEQLRNEIDALQRQLQTVDLQEEFIKRLNECKRSKRDDGKHDWQLQNFEERVEQREYHTWDYPGKTMYHNGASTLTAKMYCHCGATVAYEEMR